MPWLENFISRVGDTVRTPTAISYFIDGMSGPNRQSRKPTTICMSRMKMMTYHSTWSSVGSRCFTRQPEAHDVPARCRTTMHYSDHDVLHLILLRLGASSADQIELQETVRHEPTLRLYRAMRGEKWAYVDRALAVRLRENGAVWSGELLRDPCEVA